MNLREFTLALSQVKGLGPAGFVKLLGKFGSIQETYNAFHRGLLPQEIQVQVRPPETPEADYVCLWEDEYPALLKHVNDPPPVLFFKGDISRIDWQNSVSVVGTRSFSSEGKHLTFSFTEQFVNSGLTTVSGMAMGIDSFVHEATLDSGGTTIAVLASSVNEPTPYSNHWLYQKILKAGGVVLSETPPGHPFYKGAFLRRNRIIAALSPVTLVVQAGDRSGAVSTATHAFGYNRSVFAIPGAPQNKFHAGCNKLIKQMKASLADRPLDVLSEYELKAKDTPVPKGFEGLSEDEKVLIQLLENRPRTVDDLLLEFDRSVADSLSLLSGLEIKGCVELGDDGRYLVKSH